MSTGPELCLTKHHGLGNDFLVLLDAEGRHPLSPGAARALCHRQQGVGADGVLRATLASAGSEALVVMELWNADGSVAEMSGNGIRCLAQALAEAGWPDGPTFSIQTGAGLRQVVVVARGEGRADVTVAMGTPVVGPEGAPLGRAEDGGPWRGRPVDVGNPHLVLWAGDVMSLELSRLGPPLEKARPGGQNVEWVTCTGPSRLRLVVWERGAGETRACGTGSVAVAAAARAWGLVGDEAVVANPGGELVVELRGPEAFLTGPAVRVAKLDVGRTWLEAVTGMPALVAP